MTEYVAIYEQAEDGGWGAYLPDLPGVVGLGATRVEVEERLAEALAVYAEFMAEEERPLPQPLNQARWRICIATKSIYWWTTPTPLARRWWW